MKTIQGQELERDRRQRRIERMNRAFYIVAGFALLAFIFGAVYGWGDLIVERIVGMWQ